MANIVAGMISKGDKLTVMPHNEEIKIKSIDINGKKAETAKVGELCTLAIHLPQGFDSNWLSPGDVLCDKTYKAKFVQ